ncbi:MAG: hypothetical protein U0587_00310 [Candidatus Binatia bacterium]
MSNTPFRFRSAFLIVIANARDEVGAVPLLHDLRVKPADPALRPLPAFREVLAARAVVSHVAVSHYGLSLSAVGRCLNVSKQSIARGMAGTASVYQRRDRASAEFIAG